MGKDWCIEWGDHQKKKIFRDVKSGKIQITDAWSFAMYTDEAVRNVKRLYNSKDGILIEPNGVKTATGIPSTVEAHKVERIFNEDGVWKLQFHKICHRSRALSWRMAQPWKWSRGIRSFSTSSFFSFRAWHAEKCILQTKVG